MDKPLVKQSTMCDMIPHDGVSQENQSCTTYNICKIPEKQQNDLCTFLQWHEHNEDLLRRSLKGHHQSNVVEYNVQRAINTLSASVDKSMLDSANKISTMTRNIDRWKTGVFQVLERMRNEIDSLLLSKNKMLKAQTALGIICSISTECLERRSFRLDMDSTMDPGQVELIKEKELISEIGSLFCRAISQLNEQLNRDKNVKYQLEENWSNKIRSFKIDTLNLELNIQSPIIMSHVDSDNDLENTYLSVSEWEAVAKNLCNEAEKVINESALLRSIVDEDVLGKSSKRLRDQADVVDIALSRFISDSQKVEQALENDLRQVVRRLGDSENMIADLLRVITNLEKAKMTAETRLYNRRKRPVDENCKDSAQLSLILEVKDLQEQLKTLNYQLQCARTGHLGLQEARSQLEDEVRVKRKTLWIDMIRCQNVRAHYPSVNILIGH